MLQVAGCICRIYVACARPAGPVPIPCAAGLGGWTRQAQGARTGFDHRRPRRRCRCCRRRRASARLLHSLQCNAERSAVLRFAPRGWVRCLADQCHWARSIHRGQRMQPPTGSGVGGWGLHRQGPAVGHSFPHPLSVVARSGWRFGFGLLRWTRRCSWTWTQRK